MTKYKTLVIIIVILISISGYSESKSNGNNYDNWRKKVNLSEILKIYDSSAGTPLEYFYDDWSYQKKYNLQLKLKALGYYKGDLDGDIGPITVKAVKEFQKSNKLLIDGKAGPNTSARINAEYKNLNEKNQSQNNKDVTNNIIAPEKIYIVNEDNDGVYINWNRVNGVDYYHVYYKYSSENKFILATDKDTGEPTPFYYKSDYSLYYYGLEENQTYNIAVSSVKDNKESSKSSVLTFTKGSSEKNSNNISSSSETKKSAFTIGSSKEEVIAIMGNPDSKSTGSYKRFSYNLSSIEFNDAWKVIGYNDISENLKVFIGDKVKGKTFSISSELNEVVKSMGTPTAFSSGYQNYIQYDLSRIEFNDNWKVVGYNDISKNLNVYIGSKVAGKIFTIGSEFDQVIEAMGTPTTFSSGYQNYIGYDLSRIEFNDAWKVVGYNDISKNLNAYIGNKIAGKTFNVGSNFDQVIEAMGTPTAFSSGYQNYIGYDLSRIEFNDAWKVINYNNISNNLNISD